MTRVHWKLFAAVAMAMVCHAGGAAAQDARGADIDALISATETDAGALALARRQAGSGDITGAAVTLERSLLLRSGRGSDEVRLYYASVLCRLGDPQRGAYQMAMVHDSGLAGWNETRQACGPVPSRGARANGDGVTGSLSIGLGYESDAYGALTIQFDTAPFPPIRDGGAALVGSADINARFASRRSGHGYASASLQSSNSMSGPDIDFHLGAVRAGYAAYLGGPDRQISGGAVVRHAIVLGDAFLTEYGAEAEYSVGGEDSRWRVNLTAVDQDYQSVLIPTERDGGRYEVGFTYSRATTAERFWTAGAAIEAKDAKQLELGYVAGRVFAAMQTPIPDHDAYFRASGVLRYADYDDTVLAPDRRETRVYLRAGVGVPLARDGLSLEAATTYSARWYDDASMMEDYSSFGAELRLVYRFGQ